MSSAGRDSPVAMKFFINVSLYKCINYNIISVTLSRLRRIDVIINERSVLESIVTSEPEGRHVFQIAIDVGMSRQRAARYCIKLDELGLIERKNKEAPYHITEKIYSYPMLGAHFFGNEAIRNIRNRRKWLCDTTRFCNTKLCRSILKQNANTGHTHSDLDEINLFEFANRIGALITYIMIQALSPKKILSYNENLLGIDVPIKGKDKFNMSHNWVNKAIIPTSILSEFCKLWMVERGLAVFNRLPIDKSLPPEIQNAFLAKQKELRQYDPEDPYSSHLEMDNDNFSKLVNAFEKVYPNLFKEFENLRKRLPAEIDSLIRTYKEKNEGKEQMKKKRAGKDKDDLNYTKYTEKGIIDF
jgi:predicted transcriptional regulator